MDETQASRRAETRYERTDAPPALVGKIAAGLAGTIVAVPLVMLLVFPHALSDRPKQPTLTPPAPRLQHNEFADLDALRRDEETRLQSYGWVDRDKGEVHIPIDQAMRIVAGRGVPDWPAAAK